MERTSAMIERIVSEKKTGDEMFLGMNHSILDFWSWAHSDMISNAERGRFAEYIVSCALQSPSQYRIEWDAVDVVAANGIKVEVKSSAYLQAWSQEKFSSIQFDIAPKKSWDSITNLYSETKVRSADVYVFCLFASTDPKAANPLDLKQWEFYVLGTNVLNDRVPEQKKIGLNSLIKLGAKKVCFNDIYDAVNVAANL